MAEKTQTREQQTRERMNETYDRAENFMHAFFDSNRQAFYGMIEFQRRNLDTGMQFARMMQEEGLRFTDQWVDQVSRMQKNTLKSFHDYSNRFQDSAEKVMREQQHSFEQTMDRSFEMAGTAAGSGRK
jgi:hypothetical protein